MQLKRFDYIIVGSGIVGLAHAYWASKKGKSVCVLEKNTTCLGASIRNFGLFWPIGQRKNENYELAGESRKVWQEFFNDTGCWNNPTGSMLLAYSQDEMQNLWN